MGTRVLIVEDQRLFADVIKPALEERGMQVVDVATTVAGALRGAEEHRPELVLLDLGLPDGHGIRLGRRLLQMLPGTTVVAVTGMNDPRVVSEAIRSGFHGYLTKDTPLQQFIGAVEAVMDGHVVMPSRLAAAVAGGGRSEEERRAALLAEHLSPREREVLELLVQGATSRALASALHVSPNTVRTHIQSILTKLSVHSRLEAATFAVRHGIVKIAPNGRGA